MVQFFMIWFIFRSQANRLMASSQTIERSLSEVSLTESVAPTTKSGHVRLASAPAQLSNSSDALLSGGTAGAKKAHSKLFDVKIADLGNAWYTHDVFIFIDQ